MTHPRQTPENAEVFLDHLAHFLPDMAVAETVLEGLGFTLTPFTVQRNQTPDGYIPSGTANRCAMLDNGYLEFLTRASDTALARQLEAALARYTGVHLLAMAAADAEAVTARLAREGFAPNPVVHLTRSIETADGQEALGRFSVVRVSPGTMPEGRIQLLTHHTPDLVWQDRWTRHRNGVVSLEAALVAISDPSEAAARYGRFLGRTPAPLEGGRYLLALDRGTLVFAPDASHLGGGTGGPRPWIAGYALGTADPEATAGILCAGGAHRLQGEAGAPVLALPDAIGGHVALVCPGQRPAFAR
ncbi:VOC family protein [Roseovarius autotrophicus]|uniref:VOC family protein n=1 Tax=Roseovarius autotrophicus TaxID=2824121 RepID=UPI001B380D22|nr:VOC family protein [Roseovarius autotrophicus]